MSNPHMLIGDPNEQALNNYLNGIDREDRIEEAIDNEAQKLMAGEYSPYDGRNLEEAIGEFTRQDFTLIAKYLSEGAYLHAATLIERNSCEYWEKAARRIAELNCDAEYDRPTWGGYR